MKLLVITQAMHFDLHKRKRRGRLAGLIRLQIVNPISRSFVLLNLTHLRPSAICKRPEQQIKYLPPTRRIDETEKPGRVKVFHGNSHLHRPYPLAYHSA